MSVIRFPPYKDLRKSPAAPGMLQRFREWLNPPKKAPVFQFKNPTHWKLEQIRKKARGAL